MTTLRFRAEAKVVMVDDTTFTSYTGRLSMIYLDPSHNNTNQWQINAVEATEQADRTSHDSGCKLIEHGLTSAPIRYRLYGRQVAAAEFNLQQ